MDSDKGEAVGDRGRRRSAAGKMFMFSTLNSSILSTPLTLVRLGTFVVL